MVLSPFKKILSMVLSLFGRDVYGKRRCYENEKILLATKAAAKQTVLMNALRVLWSKRAFCHGVQMIPFFSWITQYFLASFESIYVYPPTGGIEGYLRRMIFMEFIESSHACNDTGGGWQSRKILITCSFSKKKSLIFNPRSSPFHDIGLGLGWGEIVNRV